MKRLLPEPGIDAASYLEMHDCIMRVAWCLDRGDAIGVAQCFAPDGIITVANGKSFVGHSEIERFAREAAQNPEFRGRQHHVSPLFVEAGPSGPTFVSYYQLLRFVARARKPQHLSLGYYRDVFRQVGGRYRIAERSLLRWNSELAPRGPDAVASTVVKIGESHGASAGYPSPAVRLELEARMKDYAAALDVGDLDRMASAFSPAGILNSGGLGRLVGRPGLTKFLAFNTKNPEFGGRQHRIFPVSFERTTNGWKAYSYWKVENWRAGSAPDVVSIGYYEDEFSVHAGNWLIDSKTIRRWTSETAPMAEGWSSP